MTAPAPSSSGGNELGTVFINVAPALTHMGDKFKAAGAAGAKDFLEGFTSGMKTAPTSGTDDSVLSDVIAGKPPDASRIRTQAKKVGKEVGTGIGEGVKEAPIKIDEAITEAAKPKDTGKKIGGDLKDSFTDSLKDMGKGPMSELTKVIDDGTKQWRESFLKNLGGGQIHAAFDQIGDATRAATKQVDELASHAGISLEGVVKVGDMVATKIGSAGSFLQENVLPATQKIGEAIRQIGSGDASSRLEGVNKLLEQIGKSSKDAGVDIGGIISPLQEVADTAVGIAATAESVKVLAGVIPGLEAALAAASPYLALLAAVGAGGWFGAKALLGEHDLSGNRSPTHPGPESRPLDIPGALIPPAYGYRPGSGPGPTGGVGGLILPGGTPTPAPGTPGSLLLPGNAPPPPTGAPGPLPFWWPHQTGGIIGGSGTGDTVPILAEPGEYFVRNPHAKTFRPLLDAINSGRMQEGGPTPWQAVSGAFGNLWHSLFGSGGGHEFLVHGTQPLPPMGRRGSTTRFDPRIMLDTSTFSSSGSPRRGVSWVDDDGNVHQGPAPPGYGYRQFFTGMQDGGVAGAEQYAAAQSGQPYVYGGLDCSGYVSAVWGMMTGQGTGRHFNTTSDFPSLGFKSGNMPGQFNIAVNPLPGMSGHMIAQLPNGVIIESGGTDGKIKYGSSTSLNDPQFSEHYYYPVGGQIPGLSLVSATGPASVGGAGGMSTPPSGGGGGIGGAGGMESLITQFAGGAGQIAGFGEGGPFGKPPWEWGIAKMGLAGLKAGLGFLQMFQAGQSAGLDMSPSAIGGRMSAAAMKSFGLSGMPGAAVAGGGGQAPLPYGGAGNTTIINNDQRGAIGVGSPQAIDAIPSLAAPTANRPPQMMNGAGLPA